MHGIRTNVEDDAAVVGLRRAWRIERKGWYGIFKGCSGRYDLPMYAHVQGLLGPISETDSAGLRTSYLIAKPPLSADRGSLTISCGRRVAGCDMPRCCKERTCLTREGRKSKGHSCGAGRSGLERKKALAGVHATTRRVTLQGFPGVAQGAVGWPANGRRDQS